MLTERAAPLFASPLSEQAYFHQISPGSGNVHFTVVLGAFANIVEISGRPCSRSAWQVAMVGSDSRMEFPVVLSISRSPGGLYPLICNMGSTKGARVQAMTCANHGQRPWRTRAKLGQRKKFQETLSRNMTTWWVSMRYTEGLWEVFLLERWTPYCQGFEAASMQMRVSNVGDDRTLERPGDITVGVNLAECGQRA